MDDNMKFTLCLEALEMAVRNKNMDGAILHSDRGGQFTSFEFRDKLKEEGMVQSMSGAGRCYDNEAVPKVVF
jgi:transposase InsO family protein